MSNVKRKNGTLWTALFTLLSVLYVYPIVMILLNSFKIETAITTSGAFTLPTADTFAGFTNYVNALMAKGFLQSFGYSLFITVSSVALILLCCSMCAWYITRVNSPISKAMYYLCVFSMVVPFQMVMFTLSQISDQLKFNTPWNLCVIYLGFGAGLAVFMFCGFVKSIPLEIEEAAAIDGVNAWQKFWKITFPLIGPFFTINLVLSMKNALGTFDQVVALTEGGPNSSTETVTYLIWKGGLTGGEYAYQTANAVLFFIVLAIIAFVQLRISRSQEQI